MNLPATPALPKVKCSQTTKGQHDNPTQKRNKGKSHQHPPSTRGAFLNLDAASNSSAEQEAGSSESPTHSSVPIDVDELRTPDMPRSQPVQKTTGPQKPIAHFPIFKFGSEQQSPANKQVETPKRKPGRPRKDQQVGVKRNLGASREAGASSQGSPTKKPKTRAESTFVGHPEGSAHTHVAEQDPCNTSPTGSTATESSKNDAGSASSAPAMIPSSSRLVPGDTVELPIQLSGTVVTDNGGLHREEDPGTVVEDDEGNHHENSGEAEAPAREVESSVES